MADTTDLIKTVVSGIITGGTSAATTFLTVFRAVKKQVADLEEKVGSSTDPKTGLYLTVSTVEDNLRRLRRELTEWDDQPPDWAKRLVQRAKVSSANDLNTIVDIESRVDARLRSFQDRLTVVENGQKKTTAMTREEFLEDSARRAREVGEIREEIAAVNGLLKGILVALGRDPEGR